MYKILPAHCYAILPSYSVSGPAEATFGFQRKNGFVMLSKNEEQNIKGDALRSGRRARHEATLVSHFGAEG